MPDGFIGLKQRQNNLIEEGERESSKILGLTIRFKPVAKSGD